MHSLVHVAGGARGTDRIEDARPDDWRWMFEVNVLSAQRLVAALLPLLRAGAASDGHADTLFVTSTAAQTAYAGGAATTPRRPPRRWSRTGCASSSTASRSASSRSRPGMVRTDEFTLNRLGGDRDAADAVYAGVEHPLTADDVADVIAYALDAPGHVNLDLITMRPVAQSAQHLLARGPLRPRGPRTERPRWR